MFREKMGHVTEWMGRSQLPRNVKEKIRCYYSEVGCSNRPCLLQLRSSPTSCSSQLVSTYLRPQFRLCVYQRTTAIMPRFDSRTSHCSCQTLASKFMLVDCMLVAFGL